MQDKVQQIFQYDLFPNITIFLRYSNSLF